jgi:hypothetical protein
MNEENLRALVREEVERTLDEESKIDSHPKFRRLVEAKRGRPFLDTDDWWDTTYSAWNDALQESGGVEIDQETLDYYVDRAVALIEN